LNVTFHNCILHFYITFLFALKMYFLSFQKLKTWNVKTRSDLSMREQTVVVFFVASKFKYRVQFLVVNLGSPLAVNVSRFCNCLTFSIITSWFAFLLLWIVFSYIFDLN
jgi:hypothetical protein